MQSEIEELKKKVQNHFSITTEKQVEIDALKN